MKIKKNNIFIQHKTNAGKTDKKLIHKKVDTKPKFIKKDYKSSKLNDNNLYRLRNQKIIEKKNFIQRKRKNNVQIKKQCLINKNNNKSSTLSPVKDNLKLNSSKTSKSPATNNTSISFTRTFIDPESKLKILDLYHQFNSFDETSKVTGIHSQTIRYWKKTENSIKEKVQVHYYSSPVTTLETMITEAKDSLKRSLSKNTTTIKLVTRKSRLKSPNKSDSLLLSESKTPKKNVKNKISNPDNSIKQKKYELKKKDSRELDKNSNNKSKSGRKKALNDDVKNKLDQEQSLSESYNNSSFQLDIDSLYMEVKKSLKHDSRNGTNKKFSGHQTTSLTSVSNCNSQISSHKQGKMHDKSNNPKSTNSQITSSKYIPNVESIESIVEEINKLSNVFESEDCLESLHAHFQNLQSKHGNEISLNNSILLAKNKTHNENFKHYMTDFFQGEYKLLMEINHQFQQLKQKKSKNMNKNLENLKNYFKGSMHRLLLLRQQHLVKYI